MSTCAVPQRAGIGTVPRTAITEPPVNEAIASCTGHAAG
jgi:hypothetical protein